MSCFMSLFIWVIHGGYLWFFFPFVFKWISWFNKSSWFWCIKTVGILLHLEKNGVLKLKMKNFFFQQALNCHWFWLLLNIFYGFFFRWKRKINHKSFSHRTSWPTLTFDKLNPNTFCPIKKEYSLCMFLCAFWFVLHFSYSINIFHLMRSHSTLVVRFINAF